MCGSVAKYRLMKRDLNRLAEQLFDVLIIGGGIHGAAIAREAAMAGLRTALIEQKDFSSATSANSLKILHGGFRYLQSMDFKRMRASIKSQTEFMRIGPDLISPLGCIVPTYGYGFRGRLPMRIALHVNDLIGWDRNYLLKKGQKRGKGKIISKEDYSKIVALKDEANVNGAALWFDALVLDTERLTMTLVNDAYEYGACITNYVKAGELNVKDNCVVGVCATDRLAGEKFEIRAHNIVNATGPWLDNTFKPLKNSTKKELCLAIGLNIVVKKCLFKDYAIGLEGSNSGFNTKSIGREKKRFYFFIPWRGYTMIGTSYKLYSGDPDTFQVNRLDIDEFINEINLIYPPAELTYKDVTFFHAGLLPLAEKRVKNPYDIKLAKSCEVIDHEKRGGPKGLISVRSVKYTTAPIVAKQVLKSIDVSSETGGKRRTGYDHSRNHNCADSYIHANEGKAGRDIAPDLVAYLKSKYGKYAVRIQKYIMEDNSLATWISNEPPLLSAEILYAIREEMAIRLSDVVFRRTGFGNAACPSRSNLEALADIMALELGWDLKQKTDELKSVFRSYHPLIVPENSPKIEEPNHFANFTN